MKKTGKRFRSMTAVAIAAVVAAWSFSAVPVLASETETETETEVSASAGIPADEWLPVGSVVTVKNNEGSYMVLGRVVQNAENGAFYDYCACPYPDGYTGGSLFFFNQDGIDEVLQKGFEDEYERLYRLENLDGVDVSTLTEESAKAQTEEPSGSDALGTGESGTDGTAAENADLPAETVPSGADEDPSAAGVSSGASDAGASNEASDGVQTTETAQASVTDADAQQAQTYTTTDNVRLRSEASTDGSVLATVPSGREVKADSSREEKDSWIPVIFTDNTGKDVAGWIRKDFLK